MHCDAGQGLLSAKYYSILGAAVQHVYKETMTYASEAGSVEG